MEVSVDQEDSKELMNAILGTVVLAIMFVMAAYAPGW
jgi:hypothetical protein